MAIEQPPLDLNCRVDHETILQAAEVPVKEQLPSTTTCPFCRRDALNIYNVPTGGGKWYRCSACRFVGDSIEFYQQLHRIENLREVVYELAAQQILTIPKSELTREMVKAYEDNYVVRRRSYTALFEECRQLLRVRDRRATYLLSNFNLNSGYHARDWNSRISDYVGLGTGELFAKYGLSVPGKGFSAFLVCPCYDVPGRLCSFLLLNRNARHHRVRLAVTGAEEDDGLMMLDSLQPRNDMVVAVNDPLVALQLQRRHFNIAEEQLPVVVYGDGSKVAWYAVHANKIVFWEEERTCRLYLQTKQHPRAHVVENLAAFAASSYGHVSIAEILTHFRQRTIPWAESLKRFMLTEEFWKAADFIANLKLSSTDMQQIYDRCTPDEKKRVQKIVSDSPVDRYVVVGGTQVSEGEDGWWMHNKGTRELGCNAILRLERAIHVIDTGENLYEGVVLFKGQRIEFTEAVDVVERSAAEWLRDLLMKRAGVLVIAQPIRTHLVELAKQFFEPQYVRRIGRVGWQPDVQAFVFPAFGIKGGEITDDLRASAINTSAMPAMGIKPVPLASGEWDLALQDRPECAAIWAGLACYMTNLIAPVVGAAQQPIAFVGGLGSVARDVGQHLVEHLGLFRQSADAEMVAAITKANLKHGYPVWLQLREGPLQAPRRLKAGTPHNLMTHATVGEGHALAVGEHWVLIHASEVATQGTRLPSLAGAVHFLAWLQKHNMAMPADTSVQGSVLQLLQQWSAAELSAANASVFARARQMLVTPEMGELDVRLMWLVHWLIESPHMRIQQSPFYAALRAGTPPARRASVILDVDAQKVYIDPTRLRGAVANAMLPLPDYDAAMRALAANATANGFEATPMGFVVNRQFWDATERRRRR